MYGFVRFLYGYGFCVLVEDVRFCTLLYGYGLTFVYLVEAVYGVASFSVGAGFVFACGFRRLRVSASGGNTVLNGVLMHGWA